MRYCESSLTDESTTWLASISPRPRCLRHIGHLFLWAVYFLPMQFVTTRIDAHAVVQVTTLSRRAFAFALVMPLTRDSPQIRSLFVHYWFTMQASIHPKEKRLAPVTGGGAVFGVTAQERSVTRWVAIAMRLSAS
jgi:hypothetical protein